MKNIKEFEKLFKLNFPIEENFEYYVKTLNKSLEYSEWLDDRIYDFEELEEFVEKMGYKSTKSYKLDYALPIIKEYIKNSKAYERFQEASLPKDFLFTKDKIRENDGEILLSIDFVSANFSTLKLYDEDGELGESWSELCEKLSIHPTLVKSKSFRQYVFGNLNPNRSQRIQNININKIVNELYKRGFSEEEFVFISHDEIILKISPEKSIACGQAISITNTIKEIVEENKIGMKTHYRVFKNSPIGKGMCLQTVYNVKLTGLSEKYDTLFKVPGSKFYKYFKINVLREMLDRMDLMFLNDGDLCYWDVETDLIAERICPEGEMSFEYLELNHAFLLNKIETEMPSLSKSQVRKLMNIFLNK